MLSLLTFQQEMLVMVLLLFFIIFLCISYYVNILLVFFVHYLIEKRGYRQKIFHTVCEAKPNNVFNFFVDFRL